MFIHLAKELLVGGTLPQSGNPLIVVIASARSVLVSAFLGVWSIVNHKLSRKGDL